MSNVNMMEFALVSEIKKYIDYDPTTGQFKRVGREHNTNGKIGTDHNGRNLCICVNKVTYQAARLAWYLTYGDIPKGMLVLRKDKDIYNNKIDNLFLGSFEEAYENKRVHKNNKLKEKNIILVGGKTYRVQIWRNGKFVFLKQVQDLEEAKKLRDDFLAKWRATRRVKVKK